MHRNQYISMQVPHPKLLKPVLFVSIERCPPLTQQHPYIICIRAMCAVPHARGEGQRLPLHHHRPRTGSAGPGTRAPSEQMLARQGFMFPLVGFHVPPLCGWYWFVQQALPSYGPLRTRPADAVAARNTARHGELHGAARLICAHALFLPLRITRLTR